MIQFENLKLSLIKKVLILVHILILNTLNIARVL